MLWKLTDAKGTVSQCRRHNLSACFLPCVSSTFCHINCPLLHNLVILDWVVVSCLITFLGPKKREDYLEDSSSRDTFNARYMCRASVGPVSDEGVALSSACFFSLYIWRISLIFSISSLLIFERESSSPLILSIHLLLPSLYPSLVSRPFFKKLSYQ